MLLQIFDLNFYANLKLVSKSTTFVVIGLFIIEASLKIGIFLNIIIFKTINDKNKHKMS